MSAPAGPPPYRPPQGQQGPPPSPPPSPQQGPPPGFHQGPPDGYRPPDAPPPETKADEPAPTPTPYGFDEKGRVQRTKISGVWIGLIAAAVLLILLIIFIAQNLRTVPIHFLGWAGHLSVGLALLIAAVIGVIMAAVPGTVRILQLRKALRKNVDLGDTSKSA